MSVKNQTPMKISIRTRHREREGSPFFSYENGYRRFHSRIFARSLGSSVVLNRTPIVVHYVCPDEIAPRRRDVPDPRDNHSWITTVPLPRLDRSLHREYRNDHAEKATERHDMARGCSKGNPDCVGSASCLAIAFDKKIVFAIFLSSSLWSQDLMDVLSKL